MHLVGFDAWGNDRGSSPFPPIYSAGPLTWETPLFLTPTALLSLVIFAGLVRCLFTRDVSWVEAGGRGRMRLSPLSRLAVAVSITVQLTFVAEAIVFATRAVLDKHWTSTVLAYYIGMSWIAWLVSLIWMTDEAHKYGRWSWVQYVFWLAVAAGETLVGYLWLIGFLRPRAGTIFSNYDFCFLGIFLTRYALELSTLGLCVIQMFARESRGESAPLLTSQTPQAFYGAATETTTCGASESRWKLLPQPKKISFWATIGQLLPYIWPRKSAWLQCGLFLCIALIVAGLAVNACTPLLLGRLVDIFNHEKGTFVWVVVLIYVGLKFLQGGSGLIQCLQNWLWIPIGQYVTRTISLRLFSHIQLQPLPTQVSRKTGEVLRVMDRGTGSVSQLLSQSLFQLFPALANLAVAVTLLWFLYSPTFGLIALLTMSFYILITISLTRWREKYNRSLAELCDQTRNVAVDSLLLNLETARYYGAENLEIDRYQKAIAEHQSVERKSLVSHNLLSLAQNTVITGGILAGCLFMAWDVARGERTAGDFVAFNVYMLQLYIPLYAFGTYYLAFQSYLLDVDRMLALFSKEKAIKDAPGAAELELKEGSIVFGKFRIQHVMKTAERFTYSNDRKRATVALVGPPGGGKETIFRLIFRFFDPDEGHIYIDGQDIQLVTQKSLRQHLGAVPQDPVLFNDTILYNIAYGSNHVPEDAIFRAAKAANIHHQIVTYPRGYETKIKDRGTQLSNSEKQRIAIARTLLKNPSIVLIDEPMSDLDTEPHVQQAISTLIKDRTTLILARRLSTIIHADMILVVKDGHVVESGTHDNLIRQATAQGGQGVYYKMWRDQEFYEEQADIAPQHKKAIDCVTVGPVDVDVAPLPPPVMTHSPNQAASNDTDPGPSGL
ncbi:hypothetical protein BX666DRAFT_2028189 [Dichotomocladium elegans]|nr:hypothetical protein BX666DRAFT_2028189 [Dichotomocladium elegans]